jgi:hypothetical protein
VENMKKMCVIREVSAINSAARRRLHFSGAKAT